jgi:SAM-dependent methyltransferase
MEASDKRFEIYKEQPTPALSIRDYCYRFFLSIYKYFSRRKLYRDAGLLIRQNLVPGGKFISIGAGGGFSQLLRHELKLNVVEVDKDVSRGPDTVANMEHLDFLHPESVDAIFCFEVLEHVENLSTAVDEAFRVLKPGGLFFGSVPFSLPIHEDPFDFSRFSKFGIIRLFSNFHKLSVVETSTYLETVSLSLLRLLVLKGISPKVMGVFLLPFALALRLASPLVPSKSLPTGYLFLFQKPK